MTTSKQTREITMTANEKITKAKELLMGDLKHFMPLGEISVLGSTLRGEEREGIADMILRVWGIIENMPTTYQTDGQGNKAIVSLHYFAGSVDVWIIERDMGDGTDDKSQHQALGMTSLYGGGVADAEFGYVSIKELIENGAELDLHFTPKAIRELK
jgi:hypothetical protein